MRHLGYAPLVRVRYEWTRETPGTTWAGKAHPGFPKADPADTAGPRSLLKLGGYDAAGLLQP